MAADIFTTGSSIVKNYTIIAKAPGVKNYVYVATNRGVKNTPTLATIASKYANRFKE